MSNFNSFVRLVANVIFDVFIESEGSDRTHSLGFYAVRAVSSLLAVDARTRHGITCCGRDNSSIYRDESARLVAFSHKFLHLFEAPVQLELSEAFFTAIQKIKTEDDTEAVRQWLQSLHVSAETPVFLSWQPPCAVLTQWGVFTQYWDDFCYPISDYVVIWPNSENWALAYWHEEQFSFGVRTASGMGKTALPDLKP